IYNRWGQKLYESSGPNAAWDGTSNGKPVPSDVYVWLLELRCSGEEKAVQKGDVTVLR
ncbi:MAG: gliding motility-associated C-terminal domain-containing protein, partial [Saprospiraceae bacterium]|nr:gliding motility-associated C-terminal domain-containing protein [Saprospiraceae bacterium]